MAGASGTSDSSMVSVGRVQLLSDDLGIAVVSPPVRTGMIQSGGLLVMDSAGRKPRHVRPRLPRFSHIDDFSFLDRLHGWLVGWNLNDVGVRVYRTSDGGRTWKNVAVTAHSMSAGSVATIQFLDAKRGWLVNQQPTAPNARLYASTDGGARWRLVQRRLPEIAPVRFTGPRDAWQAGGFFGHSLFHSRDGGRTWKRAQLPLPARMRAARALYELPVVFGRRVLAPVSILRRGSVDLRIYGSGDDGRTWKLSSRVTLPASNGASCSLFATLAAPPSISIATPRAWWAAVYHSGSWYAYSTTNAGRDWHSALVTRVQAPAPCAQAPSMQAVDAETSWFRFTVGESDGRLYGTNDGGRNWRRIRPL